MFLLHFFVLLNDDIRIVDLYMTVISGSIIYIKGEKEWSIYPHVQYTHLSPTAAYSQNAVSAHFTSK